MGKSKSLKVVEQLRDEGQQKHKVYFRNVKRGLKSTSRAFRGCFLFSFFADMKNDIFCPFSHFRFSRYENTPFFQNLYFIKNGFFKTYNNVCLEHINDVFMSEL